MPSNPARMFQKSRANEDKRKLKAEVYLLQHAEKYSRPRKNTRMFMLTQEIYDRFEEASKVDPGIRRLPATDFEDLKNEYSPPSIVKAKKILSIRSQRLEGYWFWSYPREAPTEALQNIHKRKMDALNLAEDEQKKRARLSCRILAELMTDCKFFATNKEIEHEMATRGYSRATTLKMKSLLGIVSKSIDGIWMWIWPHKDVQDWMIKKLENGPVPISQILLEANADHDWCDHLIYLTRELLNIKSQYANGMSYWMDINSPGDIPILKPIVIPTRRSEAIAKAVHVTTPGTVPRARFLDPEPTVEHSEVDNSFFEESGEEAGDGKIADIHMLSDVDDSGYVEIDPNDPDYVETGEKEIQVDFETSEPDEDEEDLPYDEDLYD